MKDQINVPRWVWATLCASALVGCLAACTARPEPSPPENRPNIIFIMADDLGYGDLGCYGQRIFRTPDLDQMAKEGIRFTDCYAGSPVCAPSRSVLMTGQHTGHTTVRGNFGRGGVAGLGGGKGRIPLAATDTTVATVLKNAGYTTGMIGKWGLGEPNTTGTPGLHGFDYFFGFLNQRRAHTYFPDYVWENEEKVILEGNRNGRQKDYIHERFTQEAINFIQRNKRGPFFLYLPYTIPHDDYEIPGLGRFADSTHWSEDERVYAAMVERMSHDVGRILRTLKTENIDEKTIVFFCSDNGAASRWDGRFDSSGALRGRKRDLYEGGIRTPMIVRYPGKVPAGVTSEYPWYFADVLPTLAQFGGARPPAKLDGIDVSPVILGGGDSARQAPLYWEFYEGGYRQAIRLQHWKGIRPGPDAGWEIYDLSTDASESDNVADNHPRVVAEMTRVAGAAHAASPHFVVEGE